MFGYTNPSATTDTRRDDDAFLHMSDDRPAVELER